MKIKDKWLKNYPMIDYKKVDCKKIKSSVGEKLSEQKGEVIYMKSKRFKPLAIVCAIIAVSAASIFTVNAATDGAIVNTVKEWFGNVTVQIDGEEVEVPAKFKKIEGNDEYDDYVKCEIELDNGANDGKQHEIIFEYSDSDNDLEYNDSNIDETLATDNK